MRFRLRPRYFVALLWHWSIPFMLGAATAFFINASLLVEVLPSIESSFSSAIIEACK